ncbi:PaaI family thioesterase [Novosphingobium lentum]|uniref:PaaI family thioesterase n=1 Tax=Novosphingobium lentum TaxID=145287 RepID=UPI0008332119|nr:PaaI family thioesterase [Novosphingobium lentum]
MSDPASPVDPADITAQLPPYARALGIAVDRIEHGIPMLMVDFDNRIRGRPGFLHGGAIGGLLEMAAIAALQAELRRDGGLLKLKPVNISLEYMRGGTVQRTYAIGRVTRAGRRVANVSAEAWQDNREKPIASCWMNFLLSPKDQA